MHGRRSRPRAAGARSVASARERADYWEYVAHPGRRKQRSRHVTLFSDIITGGFGAFMLLCFYLLATQAT
jgi:hypothetical protein